MTSPAAPPTVPSCAQDVAWADVVVVPGLPARSPVARAHRQDARRRPLRPHAPRAAGADPGRGPRRPARATSRRTTRVLNDQMRRGRLLHVSPARRSATSGWASSRRWAGSTRMTYDATRRWRTWSRVVPFGLPESTRRVARAAPSRAWCRASASTDKVMLWAGGIYNWFDPLTLIRAVGVLAPSPARRPAVLPGHRSTPTRTCPRCAWSPAPAPWPTPLGLTGTSVFFNDGWVDVRRPRGTTCSTPTSG